MTINDKRNCNDIENFIWNCVRFDFGNFEGIKKIELSDVIVLKSICEQFIIKESTENKGKQK